MKKFLSLILMTAMLAVMPSIAKAAPIGKTAFEKVIYINAAMTSTQSSANSGVDYTSAKGFYDGTLWVIPADTVIEDMYVIVDTIASGITLFELGDDSDANDFIASASSPLATAGILYSNLVSKGAYLKIDSVKQFKYYSAANNLKLNVTGTATAGKIRVVIKGFYL